MFIRNIIARLSARDSINTFSNLKGAFTALTNISNEYVVAAQSNSSVGGYSTFSLNADRNTDNYNNPMAGHVDSEIKPFTILAMPIYVY